MGKPPKLPGLGCDSITFASDDPPLPGYAPISDRDAFLYSSRAEQDEIAQKQLEDYKKYGTRYGFYSEDVYCDSTGRLRRRTKLIPLTSWEPPKSAPVAKTSTRAAFTISCIIVWAGVFLVLLPFTSFPLAALLAAILVELAVLVRKK